MAVELVSETFAGRVGETFEATPPDGEPFELVLSSCDETPYGSREQWEGAIQRMPFSLIFHAHDPTRYWSQGTFSLRHAELDDFSLFLVPLGPDERGMRYQAVIS